MRLRLRTSARTSARTILKGLFKGIWGLPKDHVQARFWLKKIVDRDFKHENLSDDGSADAAKLLRELDE